MPVDLARVPENHYGKLGRWRANATTWTKKFVAFAGTDPPGRIIPETRAVIGWEAAVFLETILGELGTLALVLQPDQLEEAEAAAKRLVYRLGDLRVAEALSNVEGRTPEEAASFLARADELRRRARA